MQHVVTYTWWSCSANILQQKYLLWDVGIVALFGNKAKKTPAHWVRGLDASVLRFWKRSLSSQSVRWSLRGGLNTGSEMQDGHHLPQAGTRLKWCCPTQFFSDTLATLTQFHLCTHPSSPMATTTYITWKGLPPPLHPSSYQERISLCKQNCSLVVAGCFSRRNLLRLWAVPQHLLPGVKKGRKGEATIYVLFTPHMYSSCFGWRHTLTHVSKLLFKSALCILLNALLAAPRKQNTHLCNCRQSKQGQAHTKTGAHHFNFLHSQSVW